MKGYRWMIPDCYWPQTDGGGVYVSHEAICVLNTGDADAHLRITLYFEDAEPRALPGETVPARRTRHIRMDRPGLVPRGVAYAALVESDAPVAVQYSRLDTSQPNEALMTCAACALE